MKVLVVYFSRTGKTRKIAEMINSKLYSDLEEINDHKNRAGILGFFASGNESYFKKKIKIDILKKDPDGYDLIIVGTPIWASNISSPIRSFLKNSQNKINKIAFFCTSMGSDPKTAYSEVEKIMGEEPVAKLNITNRDLKNKMSSEMVAEFVNRIKKYFNETKE